MGLSPSALQADSMSSAQQKSEDGDAWARSSGQSRQGGRVVNTLFNQSAYSGRHEAHSQKATSAQAIDLSAVGIFHFIRQRPQTQVK